jgi:hypothetical protein
VVSATAEKGRRACRKPHHVLGGEVLRVGRAAAVAGEEEGASAREDRHVARRQGRDLGRERGGGLGGARQRQQPGPDPLDAAHSTGPRRLLQFIHDSRSDGQRRNRIDRPVGQDGAGILHRQQIGLERTAGLAEKSVARPDGAVVAVVVRGDDVGQAVGENLARPLPAPASRSAASWRPPASGPRSTSSETPPAACRRGSAPGAPAREPAPSARSDRARWPPPGWPHRC